MIQSLHISAHPDAESMTSFLERSIPEEQRQAFLDHLADCERCREVMWLAQEAATETAPAANETVPFSRYTAESAGSHPRWRFAWVSGVALAASFAILIAVVARRPISPEIVARNAQQEPGTGPASGSAESSAVPIPKPAQPPPKTEDGVSPGHSTGHEKDGSLREKPVRTSGLQGSPAFSKEPGHANGATIAVAHGPLSRPLSAAAPSEAHEAASGAPATIASAVVKVGDTSAEVIAKAGRPTAVVLLKDRNIYRYPSQSITLVNGMVNEIQSILATQQPPAAELAASTSRSWNAGRHGAYATRLSGAMASPRARSLPSGLPRISAADVGHGLIALDTAGNLYFSPGGGSAWQSIDKQWVGQATTIRPVVPVNSNPTIYPPPGSVETYFELLNDAGAIWTSTDGKTWKPK